MRRDLPRLREIGPIALRHLLQHRALHQPRGIEDRTVIDVPRVREGIERRRILGAAAGAKAQFAVPQNGSARREDGEPHRGEPVDEEGSRQLFDEVLRFEPGEEPQTVRRFDFPKADESRHLVAVSAHGSLHAFQPPHQRVARDLEKASIVAQAKQGAIEQIVAGGVAMAAHPIRHLDKAPRHTKGR